MIKVFYPNRDGKIELTKDKLEKLLDEVFKEGKDQGYKEGYADGKAYRPYYYPYTWTSGYVDTTTPLNQPSSITYTSASNATDPVYLKLDSDGQYCFTTETGEPINSSKY